MGLETMFGTGAITSKLNKVINWGRKYSFFSLSVCHGLLWHGVHGRLGFALRCSAFGAEFPRFSPRQADLLMVVGTVNHKIAPVLKRGVRSNVRAKMGRSLRCVCLLRGFYRNYATVQGIDRVIPVESTLLAAHHVRKRCWRGDAVAEEGGDGRRAGSQHAAAGRRACVLRKPFDPCDTTGEYAGGPCGGGTRNPRGCTTGRAWRTATATKCSCVLTHACARLITELLQTGLNGV